jgi:hypothetical protein
MRERWEGSNESSQDIVTSKLSFDVVALITICHHLFFTIKATRSLRNMSELIEIMFQQKEMILATFINQRFVV